MGLELTFVSWLETGFGISLRRAATCLPLGAS